MLRAVIDTNVLLSAFWSPVDASHLLLRELLAGTWTAVIDNHLVTEYDKVLNRHAEDLVMTHSEIDRALDGLCALAKKWSLGPGWIPVLADPDDEPVLQLAVEARVPYIATRNERHFRAAEPFGIQVVSPGRLLNLIRLQP